MELLEGETLREVISKAEVSAGGGRAQVPLEKLVDIALQIAAYYEIICGLALELWLWTRLSRKISSA